MLVTNEEQSITHTAIELCACNGSLMLSAHISALRMKRERSRYARLSEPPTAGRGIVAVRSEMSMYMAPEEVVGYGDFKDRTMELHRGLDERWRYDVCAAVLK